MDYHVFTRKRKDRKVWCYWWFDGQVRKQKQIPNVSTEQEAIKYIESLPPNPGKSLIKNITKNMYEKGSSSLDRILIHGRELTDFTLYSKKLYVKEINKAFGEKSIFDITEQDIVKYLVTFSRSGSWRNSFLEVFRDIYREAAWQGIQVSVPKFQTFRRNSKKADVFSHNEIEQVLKPENFNSYDLYLFFLLSFTCGLRNSETRGIKVKQIFFEDKFLLVDGYIDKSKKRTIYNKMGTPEKPKLRVVGIPDDVLDELKKLIIKNNYSEEDYIFQIHNHPFDQSYTYRNFIKSLEKGNIEINDRKLCPHSLRYSFVTVMRETIPGETVRKLAGHASIEMTNYYTRLCIKDSINKLKPIQELSNQVFSDIFDIKRIN